ncbi:MAG: hypothetical protein ACRDC4_10700, partial [Plesiomonas sp.]
YISNNVEGKEATLAAEQVRARTRNALFGSQVSNADYKAADKLVLGLGNQTGPVLASLKLNLETMRDDMQAAADLGDQYVAKARYGMTLEQLDQAVTGLDARINLVGRRSAGSGKTDSGIKVNPIATPKPDGGMPKAPGARPSLDELFGGQ